MTRVAIINFTGFRGNWGCQATSFELLKFIAACLPAAQTLDVTYVPLLPTSRIDTEYDRQIDRVYDAFTAVAGQSDTAASSLAFLEEACLRRYGPWAEAVRRADLVVFQAEGSMGLGVTFAHAPRLMLLPFVAKHAWGRRVVSLNQTFYSQDERVVQNAVECFSTLDLAAFREPASVALARANGVTQATLIPDLAFLTPACGTQDLPGLDSGGGWFAISGSALKDPDRYRLILAQARRIQTATGLKPLIAVSRDLALKLRARFTLWPGSYAVVPRQASYSNVARAFAQCAFVLGGRYHMTIVAAAAGTPSIILTGNSIKNEGLAALIDSPRPVRDFADDAGILADALAIAGAQAAERAALQARLGLIRDRIALARDHIAALAAGDSAPPLPDDPALGMGSFDDSRLARYRRYGSGKRAKGRPPLPGARLGGPPTPAQVVVPLLEGLGGDRGRVLAALAPLVAADPALARAVRERLAIYPEAGALFP